MGGVPCVRCGVSMSAYSRPHIACLVNPELERRTALLCHRCLDDYQEAGTGEGLDKEQLEEMLAEDVFELSRRVHIHIGRWRSYQRRLKEFQEYCEFTEEERRSILEERREYWEGLSDMERWFEKRYSDGEEIRDPWRRQSLESRLDRFRKADSFPPRRPDPVPLPGPSFVPWPEHGFRIATIFKLRCWVCSDDGPTSEMDWAIFREQSGRERMAYVCKACIGFYPQDLTSESVRTYMTEMIPAFADDILNVLRDTNLALLVVAGYPPRHLSTDRYRAWMDNRSEYVGSVC